MGFTVDIQRNSEGYEKVMEALKVLKRNEVFVGIPDSTTGRKGEVSNAELLFIHTNGSPTNNIPPRPVLVPSFQKNKERVSAALQNVANTAIKGYAQGVVPALEKAGMEGQNIARDYFTADNGWPPVKHRDGNPLVDTGEMRKSITYVVRGV